MNILVTGAGTLVGNTISLYLAKYFNVTATYRYSYPNNLKKINNIKIKKLDLDKKIILNENFDIVVHCASAIPDYRFTKKKLRKTNVVGFRKILNSINKKNIKKVILLSSLSVYGKVNSKKVTEKTSINNPDFYGRTKFIMEKDLIEFSKKKNFKYSILRLPGIIGLDSQHNFLSKLIFSIKGNINNLILFNPELKFNNLLHVKTLSKVIKKCIESEKISGIFLLGSKHPVKIKYLMKSIKKFKKIKIKYKNNSNGFNLDISKALRYKIPLDSTKKAFLSFLNENLKIIKN
jgi:nucleoside-diphosphate-sugar epimerase